MRPQDRPSPGAGPAGSILQNHWGLYRSDDGGDSWKDVANGVPSDFGFCMGVHPRDPDTAFIVPLALGRVPLHAGREAARLSDAGRGRILAGR